MNKTILLFLILLIPTSLLSQSETGFGKRLDYERNGTKISIREPNGYVSSNNNFGSRDNVNLVVSLVNYDNRSIVQIYCTKIPSQMRISSDIFFSEKMSKEFVKNMFKPPFNKVNSIEVVKVNGRRYIEANTISHNSQRQINWITLSNGNLVNIVGSSTIGDFYKISSFLERFRNTILID